jgi:enoyl-CoA hydratase/carnithine racemase
MDGSFRALVANLLALPVPTVAAVTGHAAAAGCALDLAHVIVVMRGSRGRSAPAWQERPLEQRIG